MNRATGVSFLLAPAQPRRAASWLLIIEDCFFHPWGSVVLLGLSFLSAFCSVSLLSFKFLPKNIVIVPPHQHWSTTQAPCEGARAASDAAVPSRSQKAENDRAGDTGTGECGGGGGGGGWVWGGVGCCHHGNRVFLLALVSQTSGESQSGGNTHSHIHTHTPTCSKEAK